MNEKRAPYQDALQLARERLAQRGMEPLRQDTALLCDIDNKRVRAPFLQGAIRVDFKDWTVSFEETGDPVPVPIQVLALHYLHAAPAPPCTGELVAYHQIPDGRVYYPAFHGRAEIALAYAFGNDGDAFREAAESLGGQEQEYPDISYEIPTFPGLPLTCVLHLADEEFPPEVSVLFDKSAPLVLHIEDLAVLAEQVSRRLRKGAW